MKISAVYKITNTVTGDFYIGSSNDVKRRWNEHKRPSRWKENPNNPMYQDMQKYGVDKFEFQVIEEVEEEKLKKTEQKFIETLKPTYNQMNAKGWDFERHKEWQNKYNKSEKGKESQRKASRKYEKTDKRKKYKREYEKSDKRKKYKKQYNKEYKNQLCCYNGETLTLSALSTRFRRKGIDHPTLEAKKYLIQ